MSFYLLADVQEVDLERAIEDFDGNLCAVAQFLHEFLADQSGCVLKLSTSNGLSGEQAAAVVHDVANTLDAGWCRGAALAVRSREKRLRHDAGCSVRDAIAEVRSIVDMAFHAVEAVVRDGREVGPA
jgi:hypothetical protein